MTKSGSVGLLAVGDGGLLVWSAEANTHLLGRPREQTASNGPFAGPLDSGVIPGVSLRLYVNTGNQIGNYTSGFGIIHIPSALQNKLIGEYVGTVAGYAGVFVLELPAGKITLGAMWATLS